MGDHQRFRPDPEASARQSSESRAVAVPALARSGRKAPSRPADVEPYVTERELSSRLPTSIARVYVVTGHQSEAFDDFSGALAGPQRSMVERRSVSLTTAETPAEIAAALAAIPSAPDHVVVLIRGGGGRGEDLWAFDHPDVVNAIVASPNPVVTALGHRGNVFWADHVAVASMPVPAVLGHAMRVALRQRYFAERRVRPSTTSAPASTPPAPTPAQRQGQPAQQSGPPAQQQGPPTTRPPRSDRPTASGASGRPAAAPLSQPPAPARPSVPVRPAPAASVPKAWSPPPPPQWTWGVAPVRRPRGFGVASLVLGLFSAVVAGGFVIVPLVGLVLGTIDLGRRPRKAAIAGVVINSLVLAGGVLFVLLVFASGSTTPTPSPTPPS